MEPVLNQNLIEMKKAYVFPGQGSQLQRTGCHLRYSGSRTGGMCKVEGGGSQEGTALPSTDSEEIKTNLLAQLTAPVRWTQSVRNMVADGAGHFIELGPGKVLQGLITKTAGGDITAESLQSL